MLKEAIKADMCSDDHFSVDGTLIESYASINVLSADGQYEIFVDRLLALVLREGDVVEMDNLPSHK